MDLAAARAHLAEAYATIRALQGDPGPNDGGFSAGHVITVTEEFPSETADESARRTIDCEHDWKEVDDYPYRKAQCTKCGASKVLASSVNRREKHG